MWHAMFVEQIPVAEKILRTVLVYALVAVLFRLTGKRGMASMNTFDFIVLFLLSNVLQNAIIGNDSSLTGGAVGAITLVAVNAGINRLTVVSPAAERILEGRATTVVSDGHAIAPVLRRLGIRRGELDHAVRLQNGDDVSEIGSGRLERRPARAHPQTRRAERHQGRRRRADPPAAPDRGPAHRVPLTRQPSRSRRAQAPRVRLCPTV